MFLKKFEQVERVSEKRLSETVHQLDVECCKKSGLLCSAYLDGEQKAFNTRSLELRDAKVTRVNRKKWR